MTGTRDDHQTPTADPAPDQTSTPDGPDAVVLDLTAYRARVEARDVITVPELAAYLSLGLNTTYACLRDGTIPGTRVGRRWIISRKRIAAWLDASMVRIQP
jgi:excisionase family DNA binding protein